MKKVLGLVVSNRNFGNSELLVKEILTNVPEPKQPEMIRLTDFSLQPCKACYKCLQSDTVCPLDDDFNYVIRKIQEADALVIGVPVYFLGIHGYYKMLTDRLLGLGNYSVATENKPCVLVIPYGVEGWIGYGKAAGLVLPRLLKMNLIDCWTVKATLPAEALLQEENLRYAGQLGRDLFSERRYQGGTHDCAYCGSDIFRLLSASRAECCVCGAIGTLDNNNVLDFSANEYCRFDKKELDEHFIIWLSEMKELFLKERHRLKDVQADYKQTNWWVKP